MLQINWGARLKPYKYANCYSSVDGVDFKISEPTPFNRKWYSHKFKSAGLRYETGVSNKHGMLIWCHGPFPCGSFPDIKIFNKRLKQNLLRNERIIADDGYKGRCFVSKHALSEEGKRFHAEIRARHETVHKRLRQFGVLKQTYRHQVKDHHLAFFSVANIISITLQIGYPLFHV